MKPKKLNEFFNVITEEVRLSEDSLDSQIDALLLGYQSGATLDEKKSLKSLAPLLLEQLPGEEEEEEEAPMPGEEPRPEELVGDEQPAAEEPAAPRAPRMDIDLYAQKVAMLLENYTKLLDVMPVIINRAKNLLRETYSEDIVAEFEDVLDREFGISLEDRGEEEEYPEIPLGGNAGYPPPG